LPDILIIARESQRLAGLGDGLTRAGLACSTIPYSEGMAGLTRRPPPDLLLVEVAGRLPDVDMWESIRSLKQRNPLPVMALVARERLGDIDGHHDIDDFFTSDGDVRELALRVKRLLCRAKTAGSGELITSADLVVDLARCEVVVGGRVVELTFKEYELLKYLASHKGRVYTREALLDKVWGYDYYGGDRTVDVHIRRLRSKIEDAKHTFIETVRNIGYRFTSGTSS